MRFDGDVREMQSSTGFSDSGDHVSSGASWLPKPVAPSCTHGYGDSAEGFMHVDEPSVIAKNKVDHVKRLQEVIEVCWSRDCICCFCDLILLLLLQRTFRGLMGDIEEAPTLTPLESVEGVRYNAEQDIQDLVSAHTDFEQFFNRKRLIYSHHHPEKLLEAVCSRDFGLFVQCHVCNGKRPWPQTCPDLLFFLALPLRRSMVDVIAS